jgi:hypothetical protein
VAVLSACFGVGLRCRGSICQGLQIVSDFSEGGTKFFFNFLKFFLVQFISPSDLSPEFDKLLHELGGTQVVALCRRVVRSYCVTLGYWLVLGFFLC